jgi:hypothetical protein
VIDDETLLAARTKWDRIDEQAGTPGTPILSGGLLEGPIQATASRPPFPYGTIDCEQDPKPAQISAGGLRIDFRKLTIAVYGRDRPQVAAIMDALVGVFGPPDRAGAEDAYELDLATGDWMRTEFVSSRIKRAERVGTEQVWRGEIVWRVWSSRPADGAT